MRLLIVEDEKKLCDTVAKSLYGAGYEVDTCYDGDEALDYIFAEKYDLIVLDLNLPGMDGMDVLRELRQRDEETKVLVLSARSQIADKVEGLDAGANDYLTKPFDMRELLARIRVMTRKTEFQQTNILILGNTTLNTETFELSAPDGHYKLANKEYQTMLLFMRNPHAVIPSSRILENIWEADSKAEDNTVWTYISYLRRKLEAIRSNVQIRTMRGAGYTLEMRQ